MVERWERSGSVLGVLGDLNAQLVAIFGGIRLCRQRFHF